MALDAENEAKRLREVPSPGTTSASGAVASDNNETLKLKKQIGEFATNLLASGVDPRIVGQYLQGVVAGQANPYAQFGFIPPAAQNQGMTISDVMDLVDRITEKKEKSELQDLVTTIGREVIELKKEIRSNGGKAVAPNPITAAREVAESFKAIHETFLELGLVPQGGNGGMSLEERKALWEREDRKAAIQAEREYKGGLLKALGDLPKHVGRGLAGRYIEQQGAADDVPATPSGPKLETMKCNCGTTIYIPPNVGNKIICPGCQAVYTRNADAPVSDNGHEAQP